MAEPVWNPIQLGFDQSWNLAFVYWVGAEFQVPFPVTKVRYYLQGFVTYTYRLMHINSSGNRTTIMESSVSQSDTAGPKEFDFSNYPTTPNERYVLGIRRTNGTGYMYGNSVRDGTAPYWSDSTSWNGGSIGTNRNPYLEVYGTPLPEGPQFQRLENGVWVPATVKRFDGAAWVDPTTIEITH